MIINRRRFLSSVACGSVSLAGCQGLRLAGRATKTDTVPGTDTAATGAKPVTPSDLSVTWQRGPAMPNRRTQTTAVALDGRLYVIGGIVDSDERILAVYTPDESTWQSAAPPPKPINHTSAVAYDNRIHVFGGYSGSFLASSPLDAHWRYDPKTNQWSEATALPTARGALVAVVVGDRIYTIGGATDEGTTGTVEVYDPSEDSWRSAPSMPTAREHLAAGAINGDIYVAGGRQGLSPMVDALERYHPETDSWKQLSPMPTARAGIAGADLEGGLFVFGGEEVGKQVFEAVEVYRPEMDSWSSVTPLPTPRWGLGAATIDNSIYTVGGGAVPSSQETRTLEILSLQSE